MPLRRKNINVTKQKTIESQENPFRDSCICPKSPQTLKKLLECFSGKYVMFISSFVRKISRKIQEFSQRKKIGFKNFFVFSL